MSSLAKIAALPKNNAAVARKCCISNSRTSKRPLRLRFVAAVSASCSGDKSDKEESAGCFGAMGIVAYCCVVRCIKQRF